MPAESGLRHTSLCSCFWSRGIQPSSAFESAAATLPSPLLLPPPCVASSPTVTGRICTSYQCVLKSDVDEWCHLIVAESEVRFDVPRSESPAGNTSIASP